MSRRRKAGGHGAEFHADERWLVSYADMITVLMCLFIVLYAMSTVDAKKFDDLKNALATGFGVTKTDFAEKSAGIIAPKALQSKKAQGMAGDLKVVNAQSFAKQLEKKVKAALQKAGLKQEAELKASASGLTISLVGGSAYFDGNRAVLRPTAEQVLRTVGPVIAGAGQQITVEGHADPHGDPGDYANDWDLAGARANAVLLYLVDAGEVPVERVSSVSFGSARPVNREATAPTEKNRRVDIVVHAPKKAAGESETTDAGSATTTQAEAASVATTGSGSGSGSQKESAHH